MSPIGNLANHFQSVGNLVNHCSNVTIVGQIIGFLGAHAVTLLKFSSGINPLATSASYGAFKCTATAVNETLFLTCREINKPLLFNVISGVAGFVAGAATYTAVSAFTLKELITLNLIILGAALIPKIVAKVCSATSSLLTKFRSRNDDVQQDDALRT